MHTGCKGTCTHSHAVKCVSLRISVFPFPFLTLLHCKAVKIHATVGSLHVYVGVSVLGGADMYFSAGLEVWEPCVEQRRILTQH